MYAKRRLTESDLIIDVFFTNIIRGKDGDTPYIGENRHWWIGGRDTEVLAEAKTPYVGENNNWWIDGKDTGVKAIGIDGKTPAIGANNNWWIGGKDTGIKAIGIDGKTPKIEIGSDGNWIIDGNNSGKPSMQMPYALFGYYHESKYEQQVNYGIFSSVLVLWDKNILKLVLNSSRYANLSKYYHAIFITPCLTKDYSHGNNYLSCQYEYENISPDSMMIKIKMYDCCNGINEYVPTVSVFIPNLEV